MLKIDVEAAAAFELSALTRRQSLTTVAEEARAALSSAGMSAVAASLIEELAGHVETTGQEVGAVSRRASGADNLMLEGALLGLSSNLAPAQAGADSDDIATAEEYAEWLNGKGEHGVLDDDIEKMEEIAAFLEENENNPEVLRVFFETLGPEGVLGVPERLASIENAPQGSDFMPLDENGVPKIEQMQHNMMQAIGNGLANASTAGVLDDEFDDQLVGLVVQSPHRGWALSEVLRNGTYSEGFLKTIGNELYNFETESGYSRMWITEAQLGSHTPLGFQNADQYYDPFVGLFEAMSRTPDAALDFLYPDGTEGLYPPDPNPDNAKHSERAEYFIRERLWKHDNFDALGQMLEKAALAHRTVGDPRSELSALAATDAINMLGARSTDHKIGEGAYDSLGNILSTYIVDVQLALQYGDSSTDNSPLAVFGDSLGNLPPSAAFDDRFLGDVLSETLTNDVALGRILAATGVLNDLRMAGAIEKGSKTLIEQAMLDNSFLNGVVIGAAQKGNIKDAKRRDERAETINDFLQDVGTAIPIAGFTGETLAGFIRDQAAGKFEPLSTNHEDDAKSSSYDFRVDQTLATKDNTAIQLGRAGLLSPVGGGQDQPWPWFVKNSDGDYEFDETIALSPEHLRSFRASLELDERWKTTFRLLDDEIDTGVTAGNQDGG